MKKATHLLLVFLACLTLVTACNMPRPVFPPDSKPATATPAPTEYPYEQCGWNWATEPLPELSAQVQAALESAGLTGVTAVAEAYGENCITASGEVARFAAMETDFRITVQAASLDDREALGTLLEKILVVLDGFPTETTPGPNPGYVGVTFQFGDDSLRLWFPIIDGESARALGLRGAALLDRLQNP
ncbi:MAG: hypothetical protein FD146_1890 [Anaerolineaceae bacterium]|nr:MAG: hypothetical protein FD146_1890 [Anaerolineaceae bacterium]